MSFNLKDLDYILVQNLPNLEVNISQIAFDSRLVKPNSLFFCLTGEKTNGHNYIKQALLNGALAIVADLKQKSKVSEDVPAIFVNNVRASLAEAANIFYDKPTFKKPLIGVTGTNGKTTITHLIAQILSFEAQKVGLIGTLGSKIFENGKAIEFLEEGSGRTTPEAPELQASLSELINKNCAYLTMEVSSHALYQERVGACKFQTAVFSNLTQDHLDYHLTMENYFLAKALLFERLTENSFAIINLDDPWAERFIKKTNSLANILTYGLNSSKADIKASQIEFSYSGTKAHVQTPYGEGFLELPLNGKFNLYNSLAALGAVLVQGISLENILKALKNVKAAPGRFEFIKKTKSNLPNCIIDYAHTPDGLENVLKAARQIVEGKLICVFGCGGDRDSTKRPIMGRIAAELADQIIITSDNPRTEDPDQIIADIVSGVSDLDNIVVEPDRKQAINKAICEANTNDLVLIAGKGHENYQIFAHETVHFDDKEEVEKIFNSKK